MGLMGNAMKEKESLVQMLAMTAILGLSVRCLDHKYRIRQLQKETTTLRHTQVSLTRCIKSIKRALLREASLDSTGLRASRLSTLFFRPQQQH